MVQNLRAYFILYVITIKYIKCMQEKRSNFLACTKTKVDLSQNFRRSLIGYNDKAAIKIAGKFSGVTKGRHPVAQGWHLPPYTTPWLRA